MQLRFHESIIQLKQNITSQKSGEKHEVILIYATTRGSEFFLPGEEVKINQEDLSNLVFTIWIF